MKQFHYIRKHCCWYINCELG